MRATSLTRSFWPISWLLLALNLACPGGAHPAPTILSFTATPPQSSAIGEPIVLSWSVQGFTSLSLDHGIGDVSNQSSFNIGVLYTSTFTLTATNANGSTTASVTVTVPLEQAPVINSFTATPSSANLIGQAIVFTWDVSGPDLTLTIDHGIGDVTNLSSFTFDILVTGTFTLTAKNFGATVTKSVTVTVTPETPPVITSFTATPSQTTSANQAVLLAWTVTGADQTLTIDQGVGDVTLLNSTSVTVSSTTTFTLTATNFAGSVTATATVTVTPPLPPPTISAFTATPASLHAGETTTLAWTTTGASSLSIDNGIGPVTSTSVVATVNATTTYTLTATNATGSVTATATVTVVSLPLPTISAFTATPASLHAGETTTLAWTTTGANTLAIDNGVGPVTGTSKTAVVNATTTYTLTATNASGSVTAQATVTVLAAAGADRYADATNGLDTNDCTQPTPCKTIAKAFSVASSGHSVFLLDGTFGQDTQGGADINIPDGIALQAMNQGAATLTNLHFNALGSTSISGVVLDYVTNVGTTSITAKSTTGTPTLTITGVLMKYYEAFIIGGSVQATMLPGALAGGVYTANLPGGVDHLLTVSDNASLLIQGGIIDGNNQGSPAFGAGLLLLYKSGSLTLDNMTARNYNTTVVAAGNDGTGAPSTVGLRNNTVFDHVSGSSNDCAAGGAVVFSGAVTVTMDHSSMTNLPSAGICERDTPFTDNITITNSTFDNTFAALGTEISGARAVIAVDHVSITNSTYGLTWQGTSGSNLLLTNLTISGSIRAGLYFTAGGSIKVRNSSITGTLGAPNSSGGYGIFVANEVALDLGTQGDPGLNVIADNTVNGLGFDLFVEVDAGLTVYAVGNTWDPLVDGADSNGHFSVAPDYAPVISMGPSPNHSGGILFNYSASTVEL